jgi:hypothetical protein
VTQQFLDHMAGVDPATNRRSDLLIDTNVALEFFSMGDLLRVGDQIGSAALLHGSPAFRYRLARARHTAILMSWLHQRGLNAGMLGNEVDDLLALKLSPEPSPGVDGTSFAITSAIMHVVCDYVTGWPVGALTNVDHTLKGTAADTELLRIAREDGVAIVTNEEFTERGIVPNRRQLRSRARAANVAVYTPQEYLAKMSVDVTAECERFVLHLAVGVQTARSRGVLRGNRVIDDLVPIYRMILLEQFARGR